MCGIAGILDFDGRPIEQGVLETACASMRHRGPDDAGTFSECRNGFSFGLSVVRLAVQDPTPAGHQPFLRTRGRFVVGFNGEIYNYRALRSELASLGDTFETDADTEVVAAACARWGSDALLRFNGMWALVFFDMRDRCGFFARDRFGIKPLLLAQDGSRVFFASEMHALRRLGPWKRTVDRGALFRYLEFGYFAAPDTIYEAASRLRPGECLAFDAKGPGTPRRYYDPTDTGTNTGTGTGESAMVRDYSEACRQVRSALSQSVARRRMADVPLGAFLSGGLDSAIIATHLAQHTPGPITTFSIGYTDQKAYDETRYARIVADRIGSKHHELRLRYEDVLDVLPPVLDHLGEPFFDSSILPTAIVSRLAREHVTVCLSGDGGDELFGGYWRYLGHESLEGYLRLPSMLRRGLVEPLLGCVPLSRSSAMTNRARQFRKLLRAGDEPMDARHLAWSRILSADARVILRDGAQGNGAQDSGASQSVLERMRTLCSKMPSDDPLNRVLAFDLQYSLPGDMLHKVDLASMYHSLEVRVPFLDPQVVEAAMSFPSSFKINRGMRKRLLVDAYRGHLPDEILDRDKMGFEVPIGEFLRGSLRDLFLSVVTRDVVDSFDGLDYVGVRRVYDDHCARRTEHADLLFALLSLCWWRSRGEET